MHGDVNHPNSAIITKEQYEQYHQSHEPFINALTGELTTKTFLFIGFSFTDPNLDYILSRLNFRYREEQRQHYCFVKKPVLGDFQNPDQSSLDYNTKKQALVINDLKRYGIKSLKIDAYTDITQILKEIDFRYKKRTIFLSGSAEIYDPFDRNEAIGFIYLLSKKIIEADYKIVNGFGWGVGSSVINGALEAIYLNPLRFSESQLILKPFPQFASGNKNLSELWEEYRQKMISKCGISIFFFGNKRENNKIIEADGIMKEFIISKDNRNICIPIGVTNFMAKKIFELIAKEPIKYFEEPNVVMPFLEKLSNSKTTLKEAITLTLDLLKTLKK
jgi:Sir2- and TIR-associating SLOG family/SIR2-like domain